MFGTSHSSRGKKWAANDIKFLIVFILDNNESRPRGR